MSVGKIADEGFKVVFDDKKAEIIDKNGKVVCVFPRRTNGLYIAKVILKALFGARG